VLAKAARLGLLEDMLEGRVGPWRPPSEASVGEEKKGADEFSGHRGLAGVCVVDPGGVKEVGRGRLGDYVISSNTNADAFVTVVTKDKADGHPSERATGTVLSPLLEMPNGKSMLMVVEKIAPLKSIGDWLSDVGSVVRTTVEGSDMSRMYLGCTAVSLHQRMDEERGCLIWEVRESTRNGGGAA
jgi:hypothetical protein